LKRDKLDHGLVHAMQVFARVADAGSFTAAASQQGLTTAQVSRLVSLLEARLRRKLLQRTTRRLVLTPAGERYLRHCKRILHLVSESEEDAAAAGSEPSGHLRIMCMASFGKRYVVPLVAEFVQRYPKVSVEYCTSQHTPDLVGDGIDASVFIARQLPDSTRIVQKLGVVSGILCTAPGYLQRHRAPLLHPRDLAHHSCLRLTIPSAVRQWELVSGRSTFTVDLTGPISADSADVVVDAAIRGVGIAVIPAYAAIDALRDGRLIRCLPKWHTPPFSVFSLIPSLEYLEAKTRAWLEIVKERLPLAIRRDEEFLAALSGRGDLSATKGVSPAA
jgi:DNA-binding transcriptional LysR family regulator